jgi:hypothetical protein
VKLDDGFFRHPKVVRAGRDARDLYLAALCYCQAGLTDGFVDAGALRRLAADAEVDGAEQLAERLVDVGLWESAEGGFRVHDYLRFNPSSADVKRQRADTARRVEEWRHQRRNGPSNAVTAPVTNGVSNGAVTPAPYPVPGPVPVPAETRPGPGPDAAADAAGGVGGAAAMQGGATAMAAASAAAADGGVSDPFVGLPGFEPSPRFVAIVAEKYGGLDLGLEALKMADWGREHPDKPLSERRVLNWLQRALEQSAPPRGKGVLPNGRAARFSTDHL